MTKPYRITITRTVTQEIDLIVELPVSVSAQSPLTANSRKVISSFEAAAGLISEQVSKGNYEKIRPATGEIHVTNVVSLFDTNPDSCDKHRKVIEPYNGPIHLVYSLENGWGASPTEPNKS